MCVLYILGLGDPTHPCHVILVDTQNSNSPSGPQQSWENIPDATQGPLGDWTYPVTCDHPAVTQSHTKRTADGP